MNEKILFVDDDLQIRRAYVRNLQDYFKLETAADGDEALRLLNSAGPFAVVVSDMRMPGLDGIQFLTKVREQAPRTVRMMLTAYADIQTAVDAINEGYIFRFLTKPCAPETLAKALTAGIEQYRLIMAERELLGNTLKGSLEVLTEILSLVNPVAFSRATRIKPIVRDIATQLKLPNPWLFELAAMLSHIGCVTLPPAVLDKLHARVPLSGAEESLFAAHPLLGRELLEKIPRLEVVARIIEGQQKPPGRHVSPHAVATEDDLVILGSQMLNLVIEFDEMRMRGTPHHVIMAVLRRRVNVYNPSLLDALGMIEYVASGAEVVDELPVERLKVGMVVVQDVWSKNDLLLVQQGQEITHSVLIRLRNFAARVGVNEPIRVRCKPQP